MEQSGGRPITGQEQKIFVQNFVDFQQFCRPGAKGNTFARFAEEPRCEAACVLCQRNDFIERRPAGCFPQARPPTGLRSPPVGSSWTCRCTARLAHHRASPRRLQLGHCFCSRLAEVAETRLDTRLRSARARGTLTGCGQAEKRQCFSRQSPARETKAMLLMEPHAATETWSLHANNDPDWPRDPEARVSRFGGEKRRQSVTERSEKHGGGRGRVE